MPERGTLPTPGSSLFQDAAHEREARLCYAAHVEQMKLAYPPYNPKPWDEQDETVREAWAEHVRPYLKPRALTLDPDALPEGEWERIKREVPEHSDPHGPRHQ